MYLKGVSDVNLIDLEVKEYGFNVQCLITFVWTLVQLHSIVVIGFVVIEALDMGNEYGLIGILLEWKYK